MRVYAGAGALAITVDGPAKVVLDCKEVAEGYKVSFVPSAPGDYLITIKFVGTIFAVASILNDVPFFKWFSSKHFCFRLY